jgi:hypothetical protein
VAAEDQKLLETILAEMKEGIGFLTAKGHPGAAVRTTGPDAFEAQVVELHGRFEVLPGQSVSAIIEIDPGRVGWRVSSMLAVYLDGDDRERSVGLGSARWGRLGDDSVVSARVLATGAYVALWEYLSGNAPAGLDLERDRPGVIDAR